MTDPSEQLLQIVLLSATIEATLIDRYFGGVGLCDVPGRSFPVRRYYLDTALSQSGYRCDPSSPWARDSPLPSAPNEGAATTAARAAAEAQALAASAQAKAMATGTAADKRVSANLTERAEKLGNAAHASAANKTVGGPATEWLRSVGEDATVREFGAAVGGTLRAMDLG